MPKCDYCYRVIQPEEPRVSVVVHVEILSDTEINVLKAVEIALFCIQCGAVKYKQLQY